MKALKVFTVVIFVVLFIMWIFGSNDSTNSEVDKILDIDSFTIEYMEQKMKGVDTVASYDGEVCPTNCKKIQYNDRAYAILDMYEKLVLFAWIVDDSIPWNDDLEPKLGIGNNWHLINEGKTYWKYMGDNGYDLHLRQEDGFLSSMIISRPD